MCRASFIVLCVGANFDPTQIYYTTELILKNEFRTAKIDLFGHQNILKNVKKFWEFFNNNNNEGFIGI